MAEKKLLLLDAMALVFRAYYALIRSPRITSFGKNTNAQFGFTNTLLELLRKENPTHIAVVFDTAAPTQRHTDFSDYKANRQEAPEDLILALPDIKTIVKGFNIPCLELDGYEADDIIGTLALKASQKDFQVYMVTPDKDYGQVVRDNVFIYKPGTGGNKAEIFGPKDICEKWNIKRVDQVIDVLGLMGDAVDNIPGIAGVGEKTAAKLLAEYDTLENILDNADKIKGALGDKVRNGKDSAIISKKLATIITNVPIDFDEESFKIQDMDKPVLEEIFNQLEFKTLGKRLLGDSFETTPTQHLSAKGAPPDLFNQPKEEEYIKTEPQHSTFLTIQDVPHEYILVDDQQKIDNLIESLSKQTEISFDTETTGTDANLAELVGLSFSWEKGKAYYVPVSQNQEDVKSLLKKFLPVFEDDKKTWIGQNIKYDLLMLKWYGITPKGQFFDTMVAHYVLDADGKRSMDALSEKYLSYSPVSIETLIGKKGKSQKTMREVPVEEVKEYASEDADITWQLGQVFKKEIDGSGIEKVLKEIELPLIPVLRDVEFAGVKIDREFLNNYSKTLENEIKIAEDNVYRLADVKFNLGSPKQLGEVLFDKMQLDPKAKKTKTGQYATGEDVLAKLQNKHEIIDSILTFRELSKLKSTYVDSLPNMINPRTGRVHTSFNQTIAVTGRLSSNNPNLQNIPIRTNRGKEVRKAFIPRDENHVLLSADYSQIELRIIAAISGDANMIQAFIEDKDIHTATAARVYGIAESEVDSDKRRNAKAVNFGIIYGQSAFGLAENLGISRSEAKEIIDNYFEQYQGIKTYMTNQKEFAKTHGYIETINGRRRYLKGIHSANHVVRGFAERNSINMPIQGSAADMIKLAMIRVHQRMHHENMESRMVLQVHDELVFDVPKTEVEGMKKLVQEEMENAMPLPHRVPVKAEAGLGANWLEAH